MIERTEIDMQNLFFTYMELVSCRVYDDAKLLLNELVKKEVGREYGDGYYFDKETDEWLCRNVKYKNSETPSMVKLAIIDAMTGFLNNRDLISEEGTIAFEKSKVKDTAIIPFKKMDNDAARVRGWVLRWQKEPAITIKQDVHRISPKGKPIEVIAIKVFTYFVSIGTIKRNDMEGWYYVCNLKEISIVPPPVVWHDSKTSFSILVYLFLGNKKCFTHTRGALTHLFSKMFRIEDVTEITERLISNSIIQARKNGTLYTLKEEWYKRVPELKGFEPPEKKE